jgi:hypothetical protein
MISPKRCIVNSKKYIFKEELFVKSEFEESDELTKKMHVRKTGKKDTSTLNKAKAEASEKKRRPKTRHKQN